MKTLLLSIVFSLSALAAVAQQAPNPDSNSTKGKTFVGASISTTGYYVAGKAKYKVMAGVMPYLNIHYGYRLSKRATIQAGLGYGANEVTSYGTRFVLADSSHYETRQTQNIRA
ncbi:hypothetical protein [uncultured Pontibacter sp.]|uniref:hypothetical protein n=1 Tax=uncultured Pontibacter sp. TaxID=453356 RepID=UPI002635B22D|nr:hypothetical protein [uncultured Pontibacter sp.]